MIPAHLSFSTLTTWERCPHKFLLEKVAQVPQRPAVYFAGGSAVHKMTEDLDTGNAGSKTTFEDYFYPEVASLMEAHDGLFWDTKEWLMGGSQQAPETCDDWLEIGPRCVENWKQQAKPDGQEVEADLTGELPSCPVPIKAFADRLWPMGPKMDIIDTKTGKSKPKDFFQVETYAHLYTVKTAIKSGGIGFFMAREGKFKWSVPKQTAEEVGQRYGKAYAEMIEADRTGEYPAKREFTCKWCPVQDSCLAYAGDTKMAKKNDPYYAEGRPVY